MGPFSASHVCLPSLFPFLWSMLCFQFGLALEDLVSTTRGGLNAIPTHVRSTP